jgi:hypothetical protein
VGRSFGSKETFTWRMKDISGSLVSEEDMFFFFGGGGGLVLIGILCWRIWYEGFYIRYEYHGGKKLVAGGADW